MAQWLFVAMGLVTMTASGTAKASDADIRYSSIGYVPDRVKTATVLSDTASTFSVRRSADGSEALAGELSSAGSDPTSSESYKIADFSGLREEGTFYLEIPGVGRSRDFAVRADAFGRELLTVMLGFYGWRSGTAVELTHLGQTFRQGPGHLQDGLLDYAGEPGVTRDGSRGWYDAGDYGKYTVNGAFALGMMVKAWESFGPNLARLSLAIPEHSTTLPDYLNELKWQYDWLLTMQYSETDGRVSHKLTSLDFADFIMPEADTAPTYYSAHGSAAAAAFVAAVAQGARVYREYDPSLADRMLSAARLSYAWLIENPRNLSPDISAFKTGAYQARSDSAFRLWAAAELWETTGDAAALTDFETRINALAANDKVNVDFDWGNPKNLGVFSYLLSKRPGRSESVVAGLKEQLVARADELVATSKASAYRRALSTYYWGVNGAVARSCMLLQVANQLSPRSDYLDCCVEQIAHLFGRNYYGRSFVTGVGKDPPMHPHHRPSGADGVERPFPGLLVGGPQPQFSSWQDVEENYTTNEVAINWNGALAYALAGFLPNTPIKNPDITAPASGESGGVAGAAASTGGVAGATAGGGNVVGSGGMNSGGAATGSSGGVSSGGVVTATGGSGTGASSGCGCRTPPSGSSRPFAAVVALLVGCGILRRARLSKTGRRSQRERPPARPG